MTEITEEGRELLDERSEGLVMRQCTECLSEVKDIPERVGELTCADH